MQCISVDFNTLTSEPVDLVKRGKAGTRNGERLPALTDGYWMARPDDATWHDLPAEAMSNFGR